MYTESFYREESVTVLHDVMQQVGLVSLITMGRDGIDATHVPVIVDVDDGDKGTIHGHLFRGNTQWKNVNDQFPALVIFSGPEAYVSPSWYKTKEENPNVVPTWNYASIHAYGKIKFYEDSDRLLSMIAKLTEKHEAHRDQPWAVTDAPDEYIQKLLRGIVGFEIPIDRLEGKFKMSQNKTEEDRLGVIRGLQNDPAKQAGEVADFMLNMPAK